MNRSKDLKALFKSHIINKSKRITNYGSTTYGEYTNLFSSNRDDVKIYFYEWSNPTRVPREFKDMKSFEDFLRTSSIFIRLFERDIIHNLKEVWVSCYKGTKSLCIRGSYKGLVNSLRDNESLYAPRRTSPIYGFEPQDRHTEFNECYYR